MAVEKQPIESALPSKESSELPIVFTGRLELYSETGTEGGYWAFQDENFISKNPSVYGIWGNQEVFDSSNPQRKGRTRNDAEVLHGDKWEPLPDPVSTDEDYATSSLFMGEEEGDREADGRLAEKYGFRIKYAAKRLDETFGAGNWRLDSDHAAVGPDGERVFYGGTPTTEPDRPYGTHQGDVTRTTVDWEDGVSEQRSSDSLLVEGWSYDGLMTLNNGDKLTILDKEDPEKVLWEGVIDLSPFTIFTEDSNGWWVHNHQVGEDIHSWGAWFLTNHPARLELGPESIRKRDELRELLAKQAKS